MPTVQSPTRRLQAALALVDNRNLNNWELASLARSVFKQRIGLRRAQAFLGAIESDIRSMFTLTMRWLSDEPRVGSIEQVLQFCRDHRIGWDMPSLRQHKKARTSYIETLDRHFPRISSIEPELQGLEALRDESSRALVQDVLVNYWRERDLFRREIPTIIEILSERTEDPEAAVAAVYRRFPQYADPGSAFATMFSGTRDDKFLFYAGLVRSYVKGPRLVDVGSGGDKFAHAICAVEPSIEQALPTDIFRPPGLTRTPRVVFVDQGCPWSLPFWEGYVQTITESFVFHHLDDFVQPRLLLFIALTLEQKGRLVMIEDSYPEDAGQLYSGDNPLADRFMEFGQRERHQMMAFFDWWGNRFLKNAPEVPLPFTFNSIEGWERMAGAFGLRPVHLEFLTQPRTQMGVGTMMPKALLVFEKVESNMSLLMGHGHMLTFG